MSLSHTIQYSLPPHHTSLKLVSAFELLLWEYQNLFILTVCRWLTNTRWTSSSYISGRVYFQFRFLTVASISFKDGYLLELMMDHQSILLSMVGLLKKNVFLSESHVLCTGSLDPHFCDVLKDLSCGPRYKTVPLSLLTNPTETSQARDAN